MSEEFLPTPVRFLRTAAAAPRAPAYFTRGPAAWEATDWETFAAQVQAAARGLLGLGVAAGDRVAILAYNRPEWVIMDLATMMVGAIPVGIYFSAAPTEIAFIVKDSGAVALAAENPTQYAKLAGKQPELPTLRRIIIMSGQADDPWTLPWPEFLALGPANLDREAARRMAAITPSDPGTLLYTSGTTGAPKAVELSHAALSACLDTLQAVTPQVPADRAISYLPLAHIAEKMLTVHRFAQVGFSVYFARSVQELAQHLPEVRPTLFFGVPRVWEKMAAALRDKLAEATGTKAKILAWAQQTGRAYNQKIRDEQPIGAALRLQYRIANHLVFRKVKAAIGLDAAALMISGAAPIAPEILEFLSSLDVVVYELYGQSETCGPTSSNLPGANRLGTVGRAVAGTELRIAPDGEILVRDNKLFTGYANRPDATAETLIDGWLHSGDLGSLDADGYLTITGRKKDLIITAGGKNISPAPIEAALEAHPIIEHAVIFGDRKPFITALLTLNPDQLTTLAHTHNLPTTNIHTHPTIQAEIQNAIDCVNAEQSRVAQIRKFATLPTRFTVESGELTPTLKTKRAIIIQRHHTALEALYDAQVVG